MAKRLAASQEGLNSTKLLMPSHLHFVSFRLLFRRFLDEAVNVREIKSLHLRFETKPNLVRLTFRTYATQATLCPPDVVSGIGFKYSLSFPCST
jgi:hypothetical protein